MKLKNIIIALLACVLLLLLGFFAYRKQISEKTQPGTGTYIGLKLSARNLAFSPENFRKYGIHCDHTSAEAQATPTIVACTNMYTSPSSEKVFIGTTRFEMSHPKTPETLSRIVLEIYEGQKTSTSTPLSCTTAAPIAVGSLTLQNSQCLKGETIVFLRTYVAQDAPVPAIWIVSIANEKDSGVIKKMSEEIIVMKKKIVSSFLKSFIEPAYAGGGGGGGGGGGDSDSSDSDSDSDSISPCSSCGCDGSCVPPYVPPCSDCSCGVNCPVVTPDPTPAPTLCTGCTCDNSCPPPCSGCACDNSCPPPCDYCGCPGVPCGPNPGPVPTPGPVCTTSTSDAGGGCINITTSCTDGAYDNYVSCSSPTPQSPAPDYGSPSPSGPAPTPGPSEATASSAATPASQILFSVSPKTLSQAGSASISFVVGTPTKQCSIRAVPYVTNDSSANQSLRNTDAASITSLLQATTTTKSDPNDPYNGTGYSQGRPLSRALDLPDQVTLDGKGRGKKTVGLKYSTIFQMSCDGWATMKSQAVIVTREVER